MLKGEFSLQCLFDEKRLADTSSTIYSNKFRTIAIVESFQFLYLLFSSNNSAHNSLILPLR